jgi:hypothetical protein
LLDHFYVVSVPGNSVSGSGPEQRNNFVARWDPQSVAQFQNPALGSTQISSDVSLGPNYGHRLLNAKIAALYGEIEFVMIPARMKSMG